MSNIAEQIQDWFYPDGDHPYTADYPLTIDEWRELRAEIERLRKEVTTLREIASAEDAIFNKLVPSR